MTIDYSIVPYCFYCGLEITTHAVGVVIGMDLCTYKKRAPTKGCPYAYTQHSYILNHLHSGQKPNPSSQCLNVAGETEVGIPTLGYASLTQGYEYLTRSGSPVDRMESVLMLHATKPQRGESH